MAKTLNEFEWDNRMRTPGENAMDQYLDGQIWELTLLDAKKVSQSNFNNPDVYTTPHTFRTALYNRARRLNKGIRSRIVEGKIVIQAFDKDEK